MTLSTQKLLAACLLTLALTSPAKAQESLFNGKSLDGWKGLDAFWSVKDGTIVGRTTKENPTKGNTFLVWQGGEIADFELTWEGRFEGNNSGVQYRSKIVDEDKFVLAGYQADMHPSQKYFGMLYGEKLGKRGIIAQRGQKIVVNAKGEKSEAGKVGDGAELKASEWNRFRIVAVGNRLIHQVNDVTTVDITEDHPEARKTGVIGLQVHAGPPMKVEFRNLELTRLKGAKAKQRLEEVIKSGGKSAAAAKPASGKQGLDWVSAQPVPQWIWPQGGSGNNPVGFVAELNLRDAAKTADLYATCDNRLKLWINGKEVGTSPDWQFPIRRSGDELRALLKKGKNVIAAECRNAGGVAAFILKLEVEDNQGRKSALTTQRAWKYTMKLGKDWQTGAGDGWKTGSAVALAGIFGAKPWGKPGGQSSGGGKGGGSSDPMDPKAITTLDGFEVDHLYTVPKAEQGSWVSLTVAPDGSFFACDQGGSGLYHVTVSESSEGPKTEARLLSIKNPKDPSKNLSGAQGLVWAFDSLWFHRNGGNLYRITDSNGDGTLDQAEAYPGGTGGGEHGNHAVILSEDGQQLFLDGGNSAAMGEHVRSRVPTWDEDLLLSRLWDARGHARGRLAPGGWITLVDPKTKEQEVYSIGFRNQYDITLNKQGDLFAYDADMEWDMGTPWYRPTRIYHAVSGADFGWRSGSGKWPTYYEDGLPPVLDIGPGSPTGFVSGIGAKFPAKYQDAMYALDWTFGTIYAVHVTPDGASYTGTKEPFAYGSPLPVTDAIIGKDGHLYFTVGGRGTQSGFFRIRYTGSESTAASKGNDTPAAAEARKLRRELEVFHGVGNAQAVTKAWPHLSSQDRHIRHAARVAVESQPVDQWASKVYGEANAQARIAGAVALARRGGESHREPLLNSLIQLNPGELSEGEALGLLRAYALAFIRLGKPGAELKEKIIASLDPHLPSKSDDLNTELVRVLVSLEAPTVAAKALDLIANRGEPTPPDWADVIQRNSRYGGTIGEMLKNYPPTQEMNYAFMLRNLKKGWTLDQRKAYFTFLNEAAQGKGGASFPGFMTHIRNEALVNCTDEERLALQDLTGEDYNPVPDFEITPPKGPGKNWTLAEASKAVGGSLKGSSFENGRNLFFATSCGACHRFTGIGGSIGPDLTTMPLKFEKDYILEAIINPSKDISDQYGSFNVTTKDGKVHTGLVVHEDGALAIYSHDPKADPVRVKDTEVKAVEQVPVSQMPPGLINTLNREELRDLMAYLLSGGDRKARVYQR